jgi:membrane associated rhomboid family serine protease
MRASNLQQLFSLVTKYSLLLVGVIAILGGFLGFLVSGTNGLISALIGAAIAFLFSIMTILSVFIGSKLDLTGFYAVVLGGWLD